MTQNNDISTTFSKNMSLPVHKWYRYSAGFSAEWVKSLIVKERKNKEKLNIIDPFVGSGTVTLESDFNNMNTIGLEAHPFVFRIARAKLFWREDPKIFLKKGMSILKDSKERQGKLDNYPDLIRKCYPDDQLYKLDCLKNSINENSDNSPISELVWLALTTILRTVSPVGTAQWQYVLPNKQKGKNVDAFEAFKDNINSMANDMKFRQSNTHSLLSFVENIKEENGNNFIYQGDARTCSEISDQWGDLVITSPPYTNNYDYADATRLEMSFYGEIQSWGDLHDAVRKHLIVSSSQHASRIKDLTMNKLNDPILAPIKEEIIEVCNNLENEKEKHGGKKTYYAMVAAYFYDLALVWKSLRRVTKPQSKICFVIGDSAPYGIYVPVDKWLGELAIFNGFDNYFFEKTRDRNVKWKNRKHNVPLKEGRLWVNSK